MKDKNTDSKRLRSFGLILGALLALFGWRWGRKGWSCAPWLLGAGALAALAALARPALLAPVERNWMKAAKAVSRVTTFALLTLLYYLLVTPYGLLLRLLSEDPLDRKLGDKPSYWKPHKTGEDLAAYERQF